MVGWIADVADEQLPEISIGITDEGSPAARAPGHSGRSRPAGIKRSAQEEIQLVDGEGELAEQLGGFLVRAARVQPTFHLPEAEAERGGLLAVAEFTQEPADFVGALAGGADRAQRRRRLDAAGGHRLEERALEVAATRGAIRIDATTTIRAERGARLGKFCERSFRRPRFRRRSLSARRPADWQAERLESHRVVGGLEFHVFEKRAVAAQAAGEAELVGDWISGGHAQEMRAGESSTAILPQRRAAGKPRIVMPAGAGSRR